MNYDTTSTLVVPPAPDHPTRRDILTPIPDSLGHFLMVIDNSSMETFTTCPRYSDYHVRYAREAHARNAALTFGGACHKGWESIERDEGNAHCFEVPLIGTNKTATSMRIWTEADTAQRVLRYFTENPAPPDEYRTPTTALELLAHYRVRRTFPDYQWEVLSDSNGLLIERPFELPLGVLEVGAWIQLPQWEQKQWVAFIHVAWSGKIDLFAHCNGKNRVADNKTSSIGGDQFVQDFRLSNQTVGYVWAGRQLFPELNIDGFCLNAAVLKKPGKGQGLMERGPRGGDPPLSFFRAYFDYEPEQIAEWEHNALTLCEDFVACLVRDYFPQHTKWCFSKYGKCQYHDICCLNNQQVRMNMLQSEMFKDVTWDPTL